jgi:DNA polymerase-3 subunit epsilon
MKRLLEWFSPAKTIALSPEQQARCAAMPAPRALDQLPLHAQRLVVVDLETTGLNINRDHVLSIGAWVIEDGCIDLGTRYESTLQGDHKVSESILIHGLAPSTIAAGLEPSEALLDFLDFLGDSPIIGYHAPFDQRMLTRSLKSHLGYELRHRFFDLAEVAPMLCPQARIYKGGLDAWVNYFSLEVLERHSASADALVTAELALILLSKAREQGIDSMAALDQHLSSWRRRQSANSL